MTREKVIALLGTWSRPPDGPAKLFLGLAVAFALAAIFGRTRTLLFGWESPDPDEARADRRRFLALVALGAALLSVGYVSTYLRGGPRIIDATTYFLQGRALSQGDFSWVPDGPSASFRGRFLFYREGAGGPSLGGIFPPGYPLLLAVGFALGAPMIVGPLLAAALVVVTYELARTLAEETLPTLAEPIARTAALLSLLSAALRYHTADTMSHGAAALGIAVALVAALRARANSEGQARAWATVAGLATGYVLATRPVSAMPIALVVAWLMFSAGPPKARLACALAGMVPGVVVLLLSQRAVTGSWLASAQRMYYASSDGPPGCFRWGFGKGTGCIYEHGDFVHDRLSAGYGIAEATGSTLRRLRKHLLDIANFEPLALLVLAPLMRRSRIAPHNRTLVPVTALVGLQMLAYLPFYFDGDYPGGGGRFFADVLPIEHALVALGVACVATAARDDTFGRRAFAVFALATFGFAVHASYEHGKLRDRDGGRPMFEPDVLARASLTSGLVFVDTDHGFALGHDPSKRVTNGVVVARLRNDDRDRMLFDALERPPSYLYRLEPPATPGAENTPTLTPWAPPESGPSLRFEAEAEWPALSQEGGLAVTVWTSGCASQSRALVLSPSGPHARATITLPVPSAGRWIVEIHTVDGASIPFAPPGDGRASAEGTLTIGDARWSWKSPAHPPASSSACSVLPTKELDLVPPRAVITLDAIDGPIALDYVSMRKKKLSWGEGE